MEKIVQKLIISIVGGTSELSKGSRLDIRGIDKHGNLYGIQVKSSRVATKRINRISRKERSRVIECALREDRLPLYARREKNWHDLI